MKMRTDKADRASDVSGASPAQGRPRRRSPSQDESVTTSQGERDSNTSKPLAYEDEEPAFVYDSDVGLSDYFS